MSKKSSNKKKYSVIFAVLFVSWLVYFYFFNHYYSDAVDMVTMGAKKEIQILELFYYRGKETIIILASYFFLVSVQTLFVQYLKIKTYVNDDLKKFTLFNLVILALLVIMSFINMFWILFFVLAVISITINFVIYIISKTKYLYSSGEIIFEKDGFKTKSKAESELEKYLVDKASFFESKKLKIVSEIIQNTNDTFKIEVSIEDDE